MSEQKSDTVVYEHTTNAFSGWKHSITVTLNPEGYFEFKVSVAYTPMAYETTCVTFLSLEEADELAHNLAYSAKVKHAKKTTPDE